MDQFDSFNRLVESKSGKSIRNAFGELVKTVEPREKQDTIKGTTIIKPRFQRVTLEKY